MTHTMRGRAIILRFKLELGERIHSQGHLYETPDLLRKAVGDRDHVADLLNYLRERYTDS